MDIKKINKIVKTDIKEGLKEIYPEVFEDNKVNFEKLKALLSGEIIEKEDDRFYFNWAGKSNIYKSIQTPAYGTLKPFKEKSIDFDKTENIVIVGENLETLKLLLKPYFGKVKMIYIDPPYNTGKDFIYRDNFKEPLKDYLEKTGQIDSEGKKLTTNTETSGRYHSDWLNFMYPRLFLARSLLRDDGVIFISIDDHEVHHLRMIMDEIFGEENFVVEFSWRRTDNQSNIGNVANVKEYIVCYAKQNKSLKFNKMKLSDRAKKEYRYKDEKGRYRRDILLHKTRGRYFYKVKTPSGMLLNGPWMVKEEEFKKMLKEGKIHWASGKQEQPYGKIYLKDIEGQITNDFLSIEFGTNQEGCTELDKIFNKRVYDFPKPTSLIKHFTTIATNKEDIVLDFFAGSGTTAHAVWELNREDGGRRRFILVQLDEEVQDEEIKKGFPTVADICIERLKRVSERYRKENENNLLKNEQDFGYKVFKLDKSNFNLKDEFEFDPSENKEELKKKYLEWLNMWVDEALLPGWREIDVLYEVMLKEGLSLNSKLKKIKIKDNKFYYVKDEEQNLDFYISLDNKFSHETIEEIRTPKFKGKMFVFLDKALTDNDKINLSAFVRLKVI